MTIHASEKMATIRGDILLSAEFGLFPKKRNAYKVSLTRSGLFFTLITNNENAKEVNVVHISDVIGCRCQRSPGCVSAFITIFSYPFKKKVFSSKSTRKRVPVIFEVKSQDTFDGNLKLAERWRNVINCLARGIQVKPEDVDICRPEAPGRILVLINPHSGPGKALQIFNNEVKPMIEEAEIPYQMQVTEYAGHARDMLQTLDLTKWYGVVIVSGDGLIYEVINGLMEREDWERAIQLPVGCVPGGSGNALCCSINYSAGEPVGINAVLHSTFILIKHNVVPMDLVLIQTKTERLFSFLSVAWGIMADVDYESEKYRSIGEARFTVGALKRILSLRAYKGKVSFLPVAEYKPKIVNGEQKDSVLSKVRRFSLRSRSNSKDTVSSGSVDQLSAYGSEDNINSVQSEPNLNADFFQNGESQDHSRLSHSQSAYIQRFEESDDFTHNNSNKLENAQSLSNGDTIDGVTLNGHTDTVNNVSSKSQMPSAAKQNGESSNIRWRKGTITAMGSKDHIEIETETATAKRCDGQYLSTPLLPPLDQPVPDDWVVIDDEFISVSLQYQTHLNSDMLAAPYARFSDGFIYLMLIRGGIARNVLLNLFLSFAEAGHIDSPHVEIVKVLAFRIEPETKNGNIMVDGERIDVGAIQGQILPNLSRIMAIQ